ncbi:sulfur oxidation c-type cytochrome SoxA [Massilia cavernae]|uniref:SoxAX cytochrome complex subunit A n=1 Tax=Massilia cavernae TaxID=2320864 RepID=A0A418XTS6_9BURK|nr:sulfur oxidation c-type cytochrome SoxA [Massilia cavernae]RJG16098.1 sulfur oxidation c-type cytochrome SoxA [Massilia cavernae]
MRRRAFVLVTACIAAAAMAVEPGQRRSGFDFMSESTRTMQRDDTQNPAMLWVSEGEAMWQAKAGKDGKSCASCHGDAKSTMRGVAARFPTFDESANGVINLGQRINQCRKGMHAEPFKPESRELLSLESYVAIHSRGMPVNPPADKRLREPTERGKQLFFQRIGQLNLSCAQCHDANWGKKLGGSTIPQGHANAYPIYRLEWQGVGSLQRRLRNCMSGVRAEVPPYNAQELVELELYLAARAKGMPIESPGVRP